MFAQMKTRKNGALTELTLIVPTEESEKLQWALSGFLNLAGHKVNLLDEHGTAIGCRVDDLFPDLHPGFRLRGLRVREDISQKEMADRLGLLAHHLSAMEKGTVPISLEMAKHIGETFNISHRIFL
ncbi:MAG: helix-turn-helix domain-containing protein [Candidatus Adiutrix sp.]